MKHCTILTKLTRLQQPAALSVLTLPRLTHFMYACSKPMRPMAKRIPQSKRKKAERNCSGAKGSLAFFSSFLGLQVPVNQNLLSLSKSPKRSKVSHWKIQPSKNFANIIKSNGFRKVDYKKCYNFSLVYYVSNPKYLQNRIQVISFPL